MLTKFNLKATREIRAFIPIDLLNVDEAGTSHSKRTLTLDGVPKRGSKLIPGPVLLAF